MNGFLLPFLLGAHGFMDTSLLKLGCMIRPAVFGNIVIFLVCQSIRSFGVGYRPSKQLFCRGCLSSSLIRGFIGLVVDEILGGSNPIHR